MIIVKYCRQPKLLPCHHTFCLPCLDNCVDLVRRVLKCPECRAEHPVPYEGVKNFQSNYTLTGFLDIHLQATDDNAAQLEAYIQRYNLERCKICDEKAVLDICAHCEKRACSDCRATHLEMLKRDLTRMLNQVKRLSNRITEASDGLSKGAELLSLNCETTKDEVREYFRRYYRELKKREEMFIEEIETFNATETRLMRNLRDILEIESSNMSEGCAYLEAALKGEREMQDSELVKLKSVFSDGLEYLRNFQPDADELFSKKLRFSPGDDASKLPTAIASFGELTVMLPQFAGRYLPLEQSYLPRPMKIGYESDNYKYASKRVVDLEEGGGRPQNDFRGTVGRYGIRVNAGEEDMMSIRYRRRQQMEEEAWNRLRAEKFDNSGQLLGAGSNTGTSGSIGSGICHKPGNSPWSRTVIGNGMSPSVASTNAITKNDLTTATAKVIPEGLSTTTISDSSRQSGVTTNENNSVNKFLVVPKGVVLNEGQPATESTVTLVQNQSGSEIRQSNANQTSKIVDGINALPQNSRNTLNHSQRSLEESVGNAATTALQARKSANQSHIPLPLPINNHQNESIDVTPKSSATLKFTKKPPLPRQVSGDDTSLNEKIENIRTAHEMRRATRIQNMSPKQLVPLNGTTDNSSNSSNRDTNTSDESECENEPIQQKQTNSRFRIICRSASESKEPIVHQRPADPNPLSSAIQETLLSTESAEGSSLPIPVTHYPGEQLPSWLLRRRQRYQRSKTNPDLISVLVALNGQQSNLANLAFPSADGNSNNISPSTTSQIPSSNSRVQQLLLERSSRLAGSGLLVRQDSETSDMAVIATPSLPSQDRRSRYRKRSSIALDGETSYDGRLFQAPRFICTVDYVAKAKPKLVFGKKGSKEGELNWPRGLAVLGGNEFAVCDSSNHRICIFNTGGRLLRMFGKYGSGDAQLDSAAGICCSRYKHLIVSDRYNHRIMIFDQNGHCVKKFGGHGPSSGRFNNPWGVAVDDMGMIYVVDKDNHRVQMFDSKGQFAGKFGTMGPGIGQFHHPQFIAVNKRTQNIYVTDSSNHRVCIFDHNGNPIFQFGSEGYQNGQMKFPRGIAVDDQGFIIVADSGNNRVQIFYPNGRYMHSFGTWGNAPGQLKGVEAVALIDTTIVVSDRENHRIQLF
ncbi:RING finger protein nhl-1 [Loa loa]|uniref:RING finger protein nhl-1 n=1 Tax=Loa loa TaxID=7209 RepID=A0A1S0TUR4_LOALO|nr:RING finger protein nhl-1 [Loa loa]EFO20548.2 RING finger protein nhl-1 [Loa loa]